MIQSEKQEMQQTRKAITELETTCGDKSLTFYFHRSLKRILFYVAVAMVITSIKKTGEGLEVGIPALLFSGALLGVIILAYSIIPVLYIDENELRYHFIIKRGAIDPAEITSISVSGSSALIKTKDKKVNLPLFLLNKNDRDLATAKLQEMAQQIQSR